MYVAKMECETHDCEPKMCRSENEEPLSKLDECIKSIIRKESYTSCDVVKKPVPTDGGSYLAKLSEIDIKGKTADGEKETAIFVKSIDSDCEAMKLISVPGVFKAELLFYKEVIHIFNELQDDAKIPVNERYNAVKCYEESYEKAIIMENVSRKGFKTASHRMGVISLNMAKESVKQLAKFHGLSYVLEQKKPEYFAKKIKTIRPPQIFGEVRKKHYEKYGKKGLALLDDELRSKIEMKLPSILNKIKEYLTDESIKYCLCHGDYKPTNIMVKEVDGKVTAIPLDYQIIGFSCPILDFIFFMYMSSDRQFRDRHMIDLKNLYYKSLDDFLRYFDMTAESVFPREIFECLYQEKLDIGLAITFINCPFLFVAEDAKVPDLTKETITDVDINLDDRFKVRLRDTVEEFIDLGYL